MPEGQYSGIKKVYQYTADNTDDKYLLTLDETLGSISGCDLVEATSATVGTPPPSRFKPRIVYWQGVLDGRIVRKALVCNTSGDLYASTSKALTIDGVAGSTTGRRGEQMTFPRIPAAST